MLSEADKFFNFLEIDSWNINGIFQNAGLSKVSKLTDNDFLQQIHTLDIFALSETHTGPEQEISLKNFTSLFQ